MRSQVDDPAHRAHSDHLISTRGMKAERVWHPPEPMLESVRHELLNEAQSHSRERCGLIDAEWEVWHLPNTHEEPTHNFYIDEEDVGETLKKIYQVRESRVIATWHTHPNNVPWPSPRDIRGWPPLALGWRYFIVTNDEVYEWELVQA